MSSDITVRLRAQTSQFKRAMADGSKSVGDFARNNEEMAKRVARASAITVTAVAAIGGAVLKMASEAAKAGVEIRNLAATAGTSTTNFQKMADASRTVGVEQEKLSDILKDVNDKFGDFQATGAGPLADFFENIAPKIGVTAEQFANLAGPDALQLYVSSLEEAGVSQQQMTFYMEALASDATRLLPLLRNNGVEMSRLGDEAQRAGRILSEDMIQSAVELDRELANLSNQLKTQATAAVLEYKDEIIGLINFITEKLIPSIGGFLGWVDDGVKGWQELGRAAQLAGRYIAAASENQRNSNLVGGTGPGVGDMPSVDDLFGGGSDPSTLTPEAVLGGLDTRPQMGPQLPDGWQPMNGATGFDGEGGLLPEQSASDMARAAWERTQEVQEEIRTGTAFHEDELTRIEETAAKQRERIAMQEAMMKRQAMATFFSDATSLMQSENKKLFEIGKAAAIAEATVSGYKAATSAWEKGMAVGGPPVAAAFTAASLARTGLLISQIQSQQSSGSSGGSSAAGGGSTPATQSSGEGGAPRREVNLTLVGDQGFSRAQIVQLAEALSDSGDDGQQLVNITGRR